MLKTFGYHFKDEIPPLFRKKPVVDNEMKMLECDSKFKSNNVDSDKNWQNIYKLANKDKPHINVIKKLTINDKTKCLNKLLYESSCEIDDNKYKSYDNYLDKNIEIENEYSTVSDDIVYYDKDTGDYYFKKFYTNE